MGDRYNASERFISAGIEITVGDTLYNIDRDNSNPYQLIDFQVYDEAGEYNQQNSKILLTSNILDVSAQIPETFRKLLVKGSMIRPWIQTLHVAGEKQYLGKFFINNVSKNTEDIQTVITAYDRLYDHLDKDQDTLILGVHNTVEEFLTTLFEALGFTSNEYVIEEAIKNLPNGKYYIITDVKTTLQYLMDSFDLIIYCDREGIIRVQVWGAKTTSAEEITDKNQIYSAPVVKELKKTFAGVQVHYKTVTQSDLKSLLTLSRYTPKEDIEIFNYSAYPVLGVAYITVENDSSKSYLNGIDVTILPQGVKIYFSYNDKLTIDVVGSTLETEDYYVNKEIGLNENAYAEAMLKVDVPYIQTKAQAEAVANRLVTRLSKGNIFLSVDGRGNPDLIPLGACKITADSIRGTVNGICLGQIFTYDGALTATMNFIVPDGLLEGGN